jgi:hypothetical protein
MHNRALSHLQQDGLLYVSLEVPQFKLLCSDNKLKRALIKERVILSHTIQLQKSGHGVSKKLAFQVLFYVSLCLDTAYKLFKSFSGLFL